MRTFFTVVFKDELREQAQKQSPPILKTVAAPPFKI